MLWKRSPSPKNNANLTLGYRKKIINKFPTLLGGVVGGSRRWGKFPTFFLFEPFPKVATYVWLKVGDYTHLLRYLHTYVLFFPVFDFRCLHSFSNSSGNSIPLGHNFVFSRRFLARKHSTSIAWEFRTVFDCIAIILELKVRGAMLWNPLINSFPPVGTETLSLSPKITETRPTVGRVKS